MVMHTQGRLSVTRFSFRVADTIQSAPQSFLFRPAPTLLHHTEPQGTNDWAKLNHSHLSEFEYVPFTGGRRDPVGKFKIPRWIGPATASTRDLLPILRANSSLSCRNWFVTGG